MIYLEVEYYVNFMNKQEKVQEILKTLRKRHEENRLNYYKPYDFQKRFHATGLDANQRLLMAANRVGKSYVGAMEMSIHLTGVYPDWWKGKKFLKPIRAWVCGASNETTRDICQKIIWAT